MVSASLENKGGIYVAQSNHGMRRDKITSLGEDQPTGNWRTKNKLLLSPGLSGNWLQN